MDGRHLYTVFAHKLIPGTQRDSLPVLDGLLASQTGIQREMVSTGNAAIRSFTIWAAGSRPRLPRR